MMAGSFGDNMKGYRASECVSEPGGQDPAKDTTVEATIIKLAMSEAQNLERRSLVPWFIVIVRLPLH